MIFCKKLILLITLSSSFVYANDTLKFVCNQSKVKIPYEGKTIEKMEALCSTKDHSALRSKNCLNLECVPKDKLGSMTFGQIFTSHGNPGFTACILSGGTPELIEFFADKEWHELDRCNYKNGFVSTGALIPLLKK